MNDNDRVTHCGIAIEIKETGTNTYTVWLLNDYGNFFLLPSTVTPMKETASTPEAAFALGREWIDAHQQEFVGVFDEHELSVQCWWEDDGWRYVIETDYLICAKSDFPDRETAIAAGREKILDLIRESAEESERIFADRN